MLYKKEDVSVMAGSLGWIWKASLQPQHEQNTDDQLQLSPNCNTLVGLCTCKSGKNGKLTI